MNIRIVSIDQIIAAASPPRVDLQPGDVEYEKLRRSIEESAKFACENFRYSRSLPLGSLKRMIASRGYQVHDNKIKNVLTVSP
ncbi:hypothetical protein J2T19_002329 [Paenibacillus tundrae]|uniref:Uncharacterized protein n=1 Tax=Paenibacillus tundrae TaxID=528187 RepID=A0ABT9WCD7_9BACL|nr:hypothetical protein [Paenibacillus tundrae]